MDLPDRVYSLDQAFWMLFPTEYCYARVSSPHQGVHNGSGYFESTWCTVWMLGSDADEHETQILHIQSLTLIANIQMAAITSRDPLKTRLSHRVGSYSQIAVAFSMAAILVMWDMTSTFPRLTMCPKQLQGIVKQVRNNREFWTYGNCCSSLSHLMPQQTRIWICSMVQQVVLLFPVLSNIAM